MPARMNEMCVEVPGDYLPSLSEDYMNPMQIEYFRRKLQQSRADLQRKLKAIPHIEPDKTGDQTHQSSAVADRSFNAVNRARIQKMLHQTE